MEHYVIRHRESELLIYAEDGELWVSEHRSVYTNIYGMSYVLPFDGNHFRAGRYRLTFNPNGNPLLTIAKRNPSTKTVAVVCEVSKGAGNSAVVNGDEGQLLQLMETLFCLSIPAGGAVPDPEDCEGEQDYILFAYLTDDVLQG